MSRPPKLERILNIRSRLDADVGMTPSMLLQTTLPHSEPTETVAAENGEPTERPARDWEIKNGGFWMNVTAGRRRYREEGRPEHFGIPYGGTARYILAYITTRALVTKSRKIDFGEVQSHLLERLDIGRTGGKHGRIRYVQDQLLRIANAHFTFEMQYGKGEHQPRAKKSGDVASEQRFWFQRGQAGAPDQLEYFGVELGEKFFESIQESSIPIDLNLLRELVRSPLGMDLYVWLTYKAYRLWNGLEGRRREGESVPCTVVSWKALHPQFGHGYARASDFGRRARNQIDNLRTLWTDLREKVQFERGRIIVYRMRPHIQSLPQID